MAIELNQIKITVFSIALHDKSLLQKQPPWSPSWIIEDYFFFQIQNLMMKLLKNFYHAGKRL